MGSRKLKTLYHQMEIICAISNGVERFNLPLVVDKESLIDTILSEFEKVEE